MAGDDHRQFSRGVATSTGLILEKAKEESCNVRASERGRPAPALGISPGTESLAALTGFPV